MPPLSIATGSTPTAAPNSGPAAGSGQAPPSASAPGAAATGDQGSAGGGTAHARPPSPPPPPVSPITPTLRAARLAGSSSSGPAIPVPTTSGSSTHYTADPSPSAMTFFAANRVALTHSSQPAQAAGALEAPPPPLPLDFDANPDVLALKSAISVLQIQRARAAADVARLSRAKAAALENPDAFLRDLAEGRVSTAPAAPTLFGTGGGDDSESESESDSSESDGAEHASHPAADDLGKGKQPATGESSDSGDHVNQGTDSVTQTKEGKRKKKGQKPQQPPWRELPQRQNVVRCPPINWAQYAVVGESLEKLHNEQLTRPDLGTPRVVAPGGVYEFKGDQRQQPGGAQPAQRLVGVASPYAPGRDRLDKKPKKPKPPT
ncbi:hypothetical protein RB595_009764 [Gaeumannomyces hyphopodioides]